MEQQNTNLAAENTNQETTVSKQAQDTAKKIQELMAQGKTMEEAVAIAMAKTPRSQIDRVALINSMTSLTDLKSARKTAYAKKSKSKGKPDTEARYQLEIDAASARINEIIALINKAPEPWKAAIEYGDSPDGALQYFIQSKEDEINPKVDALPFTKAQTKQLLSNCKADKEFVPEQLKGSFLRRLQNNDQRLLTLARRITLLAGVEAGTIKAKDDKAPKNTPPQAPPAAEPQNTDAKSLKDIQAERQDKKNRQK